MEEGSQLWARRLVLSAILALALAIPAGCGSTPPAGGNNPGPGGSGNSGGPGNGANTLPTTDTTISEVTYQDNAHVVPQATLQDKLIAAGDDSSPYRFDASATDVAALQTGDVVIFEGQALRKVTDVTTTGGEVQVSTTSATLNEAIRDGRLAWVRNIDIGALPAPELESDADSSWAIEEVAAAGEAGARAGAKYKISGKIGSWDVEAEVQPTAERLNLTFGASVTTGGTKIAALKCAGFVTAIRQTGDVQFSNGDLTNMTLSSDGYTGEAEVKWAAFNSGNNAITEFAQLKIPVSIPFPVQVGPITFVIRLKIAARVVPELRFDQSSSSGSFKATFSCDQGYKIENGQPSVLGQLLSGDIQITGETVSAGFLAAGFAAGFEFPRLEVSLFGTDTMAFVTVDTYAFSIWDPEAASGSKQCGGVRFKAIAGYKLAILGKTAFSQNHEIWKKDFDKCLSPT